MKQTVESLLKNHKLRLTDTRKDVLSVFLQQTIALTQSDVEQHLPDEFDRVTLYRILNKFVEHGILHEIKNGVSTHYAICEDCEFHHHDDDHFHFKCVTCEIVECLPQKTKLQVQLPTNYSLQQVNVLIEGVCKRCQ